jgi:hypothetical protein
MVKLVTLSPTNIEIGFNMFSAYDDTDKFVIKYFILNS